MGAHRRHGRRSSIFREVQGSEPIPCVGAGLHGDVERALLNGGAVAREPL